MCLLCVCARLFIVALWSPAGKGLTSWFSFVMSNCALATFTLVSWVRLYLIVSIPDLALFLTYGNMQITVLGIIHDAQVHGRRQDMQKRVFNTKPCLGRI